MFVHKNLHLELSTYFQIFFNGCHRDDSGGIITVTKTKCWWDWHHFPLNFPLYCKRPLYFMVYSIICT